MAGRAASKSTTSRTTATDRASSDEVDRLRMELDAANERIRILEDERREIGERVAWALETIQSVLEENG